MNIRLFRPYGFFLTDYNSRRTLKLDRNSILFRRDHSSPLSLVISRMVRLAASTILLINYCAGLSI